MTRSRDLADSADKDISGTLVVDSLTSSGNVGIGGSASQRLHVQGGSLLIDNGSSAGTIYLHDTTNYINLSSDAMQFATNGAERVRIDADGHVKINGITTTGLKPLMVKSDSDHHAIHIEEASGNEGYTIGVNAAGDLGFHNSGAVDATVTIDDSGRFMLSKTSAGVANSGGELRPGASGDYAVVGTTTSQAPFIANRKSDDGDLFRLRKDNASVGSIGTSGGNLIVQGSTATGKTGIKFGGAEWIPQDNGNSDGGVDLGGSSYRFKDLYLSGNVIISGSGKGINFAEPTSQSGSVSQILDAYEEGTWVPTTNYGTISNNCWYIKIGNSVTVGGNIWNPTNSSSTYPFAINALPFAAKSGKSSTGAIIGAYIADPYYSVYISGGTSQLYFYKNPSTSGFHILTHADLASNSDMHFAITYYSA